MGLYYGNMQYDREETLMVQGRSHLGRKVEDSDSYISRVSYFMIYTKKYNKGHIHQSSFEENIVVFMAKAYTPLSFVYFHEFRKLISSLEPSIFPVS